MSILVPDTATRMDFEIHQGETWIMDFEVVDKAGAPVPTTGFTVKAMVRDALDSPRTPYFTWTGSGVGVAIGSLTSVRLITTKAQTALWVWRSGWYDIRVTDTASADSYIAKGTMTVIPMSTN